MSTVANNILAQLGGSRRLNSMLGAYDFMGDETSLTFKWKVKGNGAANCAKVTLDPTDTYSVTFYKITRGKAETVKEVPLVYSDNLQSVIENTTGLYLSL